MKNNCSPKQKDVSEESDIVFTFSINLCNIWLKLHLLLLSNCCDTLWTLSKRIKPPSIHRWKREKSYQYYQMTDFGFSFFNMCNIQQIVIFFSSAGA